MNHQWPHTLIAVVLTLFVSYSPVFGQQIIDADTGEPVSYANIRIAGSEDRGTSAGEDGTFVLDVPDSTVIRVSCVGFKPQTAIYVGPETLVLLERIASELQEVVVRPDESEAVRVIRKCVENRSRTAPQGYPYYQCYLYNKFRADLLKDSSGSVSAVQQLLEKTLEGETIFFSESAMTRRYQRPDRTQEEIVANKVVGFKTPDFNFLPEQFVPFDINRDFLDLLNRDYLTPISKGSESSYVLHLEEKVIDGSDTTWHIIFWPQGSQYDLLRGNVVITSDQYALEELRLSNDKRDAVRFDIYHHYRKWNGNWFPDQIFADIILADVGLGINVLYQQRTYVDSVTFDVIPVDIKDANRIAFAHGHHADSVDIAQYRTEPLSSEDSVAIISVQATADKIKMEQKTDVISHLSFGRVPIGPIDIDLYRTFYGNASEGWRLGTGVITNDNLSKHFAIDAYYGYGLKDEISKYGGGISVNLNEKETMKSYLRFDKDVKSVSSYKVTDLGTSIVSAYYANAFEDLTSITFGFAGRRSNWGFNAYFERSQTKPRFEYAYEPEPERTLTTFDYSTFGLFIDFLQRKYVPYYNYDIVLSESTSPYLSVHMSYAVKGVWDSNVNAFRTEVFYKQPIKLKKYGDAELAIHMGAAWGDTPLDLLHVGNGTDTDGIPFQTTYAFNTMAPFTYFADRYFNVYYRHRIMRLYLTKYSAPRLSVNQQSGWGALRNPDDQRGIDVKDYHLGFHESGIVLEDILRYSAFSLFHFGLNLSAWYRWGPYSGETFNDNFAWKIGISMGI